MASAFTEKNLTSGAESAIDYLDGQIKISNRQRYATEED
jgi:hypothetical protein